MCRLPPSPQNNPHKAGCAFYKAIKHRIPNILTKPKKQSVSTKKLVLAPNLGLVVK